MYVHRPFSLLPPTAPQFRVITEMFGAIGLKKRKALDGGLETIDRI